MVDCRGNSDGFRDIGCTLERHILGTLGLQKNTQSLPRIRTRNHSRRTFPVDVIVGIRGVVAFLSILAKHTPRTSTEVQPHIPSIDELRNAQTVNGRHINLFVAFLVFIYPRAAQHNVCTALLQRRNKLFDTHFGIGSTDKRFVPIPIAALNTR